MADIDFKSGQRRLLMRRCENISHCAHKKHSPPPLFLLEAVAILPVDCEAWAGAAQKKCQGSLSETRSQLSPSHCSPVDACLLPAESITSILLARDPVLERNKLESGGLWGLLPQLDE